jgi:ActR/RegA family two-component response regulator/energy-coupling factor transporter ATP-binding protein EcfA2
MKDDASVPSIVGATSILDLLSEKIVGQQTAISGIASAVKTYQAGLSQGGRPAGVFLLLGPTGTGKTRTVEALAEILHGSSKKVVKIDCGEFQTDHELAKLLGAPPGYLGHRETNPILTQERLRDAASEFCDLSIVLFDEIEKAASGVSKLLLGVLDKATLRLGDNTEVNFEKSLIFLTSNLGAREMMKELQPELGFRPAAPPEPSGLMKKLEGIALNAVRRMYSPEFVNRIDAVITYQPLDSEALALILDQQIVDLQKHVNSRLGDKCFSIEIGDESRTFLLEKGTSPEYGARELKRSIHKFLTQPLATLVIESKIPPASTVRVLISESKDSLTFETTTAERPRAVSRPTILIVDDNRDFLRLLSLELTEATKWGVSTAQSFAEAEPIQAAASIHFALLDLILPDGNGIDLGVKLREREPDIHIAIMTGGELTTAEENECRKHRFDIVNKPFLPQQIVSLVRERVIKSVQASA